MLPGGPYYPASLQVLLACFQPCFTAPSFRTFCALAWGFWAQTGRRTVCGMLVGAGLSRLWPHDRAHDFFTRARWQPADLGLALARLVVALLVPGRAPVMVAVDDTLFRRRGKKIWAASWSHDGSAAGKGKTGYGHNWVIAGIIVMLPMISRPVCLPILFRLVIKGTNSTSRLWLARRMAETLAAALPGRMIHVTGDAAYAGKELRALPGAATWATRFRKDAALHEPPPRRTGQPAMYAPHWPRSSGTTCTRGSRASSTLPVLRRRHDTGLLVCTWPYGGRPTVPIRYADEIWSGVEYQVAGHLAYEGMTA